ncbi:hypothetical protein [Paenibacillus solani]|uniref:hypothetical protein n=1 Tax=Paenibacillus solani TaxID=1705565 RepID=UPI003D28C8B6
MEEIKNSEMQDGVITLVDVLGWKGIWKRNSNALFELSNLINLVDERASEITSEDKFKQEKAKRFKKIKPEIRSISDTIAIITYL